MVTLPDAAKLTSMQITSPTPGTQVEIRTAPSPNTSLDPDARHRERHPEGRCDGNPTHRGGCHQERPRWITDLSATSGKNQSGIAEVAFTAAS